MKGDLLLRDLAIFRFASTTDVVIIALFEIKCNESGIIAL